MKDPGVDPGREIVHPEGVRITSVVGWALTGTQASTPAAVASARTAALYIAMAFIGPILT
jgi:hypothetical protein